MSDQSSEIALSPSTVNAADCPTPIVLTFRGTLNQNTSANTNTAIAAIESVAKQGEKSDSSAKIMLGLQQSDSSNNHIPSPRNNHIPSPPAIHNWHTMSTAATTITSNLHPRASSKRRIELLPDMLPMVVPAHHRSQADIVIDDDLQSRNIDVPPVCEIQIPSQQRPKRQADKHNDDDYDDMNDDADTTTSTQNLSRDDHQHYNAIDYKGMYFTSQRQNYALREQVDSVQEENRKLKRQLIEMQKQLYAYSRNKRTVVSSSMYSQSNHDMGEVAPWSIPMTTNMPRRSHHHHDQQQPRVLVVRHPHTSNVIENAIVSPKSPTSTTNYMDNVVAPFTSTAATTANTSPIPGITTASPTNGVSMSVSSEEGTILH